MLIYSVGHAKTDNGIGLSTVHAQHNVRTRTGYSTTCTCTGKYTTCTRTSNILLLRENLIQL